MGFWDFALSHWLDRQIEHKFQNVFDFDCSICMCACVLCRWPQINLLKFLMRTLKMIQIEANSWVKTENLGLLAYLRSSSEGVWPRERERENVSWISDYFWKPAMTTQRKDKTNDEPLGHRMLNEALQAIQPTSQHTCRESLSEGGRGREGEK